MTILILSLLLMVLPIGCTTIETPYMAEATSYTEEAIRRGMQEDNNGLAEQATIALRYVYLMEREKKKEDPYIEQVIKQLKEAILHARYGRSEEGVDAAERAAEYLAEMEQEG